jgi:hypothetical protein
MVRQNTALVKLEEKMDAYLETLKLVSGTVVIDGSGIVWVKKGFNWQRTGSAGFYDGHALVSPIEVLIPEGEQIHPFVD